MTTLAERICTFLNEEGHVVDTDRSIDTTRITFRSRGLHFSAAVSRDQNRYLQLSCSMRLEPDITFDADLLRALWDCQNQFKAVKYAITRDATCFVCSTEAFFSETSADEATFWRAIGVIEAALFAGMREIRAKHMVKTAAEKFIAECLPRR